MGKIGKTFALFLTLTIAISCLTLLTAKPANAQIISKPSVPEFSVVFVNHSYDVPSTTTTTINPYTGDKIVTTKEGYHIQNDSFVISIRSQPLTAGCAVNGSSIDLFFIVQSKGHYSDYWENLTYVGNSLPLMYTNNGYAQKTMQLTGNNGTTYTDESGYNNYGYDGFVGGQYGGQVDFRAMAVIGYIVIVQDAPNPFNIRHPYHDEFIALQSSDWSNIQTISIPDGKVTTSSAPTPTVPELTLLAILPLFVSIFIAIAITRLRKSKTNSFMPKQFGFGA
ncbi:MAG: hypothetical protein NWE98_10175 [Candidatus Bathyarchaeota archaeon]|nr:hypothetical protein [Candidatus Bathyarchaeota archaeon]